MTLCAVLVCGRGRDRGVTACHCRGLVLSSRPRHQPGLNHEQEMPNCRLAPSRRNISRYQTPHSATVQYIEISTYLYIYATPESRPVTIQFSIYISSFMTTRYHYSSDVVMKDLDIQTPRSVILAKINQRLAAASGICWQLEQLLCYDGGHGLSNLHTPSRAHFSRGRQRQNVRQ